MNFIGQDKATYTYLLRYLCTDEVPTPNELSKIYTVRSPKTPMCDSDIDSSHQKPSNEMSNSSKKTKFIKPDTAPYAYWLRCPCTDHARTPTELSIFYVIGISKTLMCDSDIDSSHQNPSSKMSNSTKTRSSSGQIRSLMPFSFAICVLTKSLKLTNYLKFTSLEARKPPKCDSDIHSSHQKPSNEMSNSSKR